MYSVTHGSLTACIFCFAPFDSVLGRHLIRLSPLPRIDLAPEQTAVCTYSLPETHVYMVPCMILCYRIMIMIASVQYIITVSGMVGKHTVMCR